MVTCIPSIKSVEGVIIRLLSVCTMRQQLYSIVSLDLWPVQPPKDFVSVCHYTAYVAKPSSQACITDHYSCENIFCFCYLEYIIMRPSQYNSVVKTLKPLKRSIPQEKCLKAAHQFQIFLFKFINIFHFWIII